MGMRRVLLNMHIDDWCVAARVPRKKGLTLHYAQPPFAANLSAGSSRLIFMAHTTRRTSAFAAPTWKALWHGLTGMIENECSGTFAHLVVG